MWEIEFTDQFHAWWVTLTEAEQDAIDAAVRLLEERGPALRRPLVGPIATSRHSNMKELIPPGGGLRILFAFDPRRTAILLIGGDKSGRWKAWYEVVVPMADALYDQHLAELRVEGWT